MGLFSKKKPTPDTMRARVSVCGERITYPDQRAIFTDVPAVDVLEALLQRFGYQLEAERSAAPNIDGDPEWKYTVKVIANIETEAPDA